MQTFRQVLDFFGYRFAVKSLHQGCQTEDSLGFIYFSKFTGSFLVLCLLSGEGGLEVCGHGRRPHLPVDVHHSVSAGDRWTLSASVALWDDLKPRLDVKNTNILYTKVEEHG